MSGRRETSHGHAAVVGAGMAGLLSARVLLDRFDRVTLVERDGLPEGGVARRGVPQARHLHSLATRGSEILEDLFPGFDAELAAEGCPLLDQAADAVTVLPAGSLPRFHSGITMRAASRAVIERHVRARLEDDPRTTILPGREAVGLIPGSGNRVCGLRTRLRSDGSTEDVLADLVIDAGGASSRAPRWLAELGYKAPKETVVDARLGYATRWYRAPEGFDDWTGVAVLPGWPGSTRGGTLRRVEEGLWTAVLIGTGGDYPPTDPEGFVRFARSLHDPIIHDAIEGAEPASPVYGYRRTANRMRHYERMRLPDNFLVIGDAACVLNPSYGQGMTAAALSAMALRDCLKGGRASLSRRFQRRQRRAIAPCWTATTNSDAQWAAKGVLDLNPVRRALHGISNEVMKLAVEREDVARTLLEVKNLLSPPAALLRPGILFPALARAAKPRPARHHALPQQTKAGR